MSAACVRHRAKRCLQPAGQHKLLNQISCVIYTKHVPGQLAPTFVRTSTKELRRLVVRKDQSHSERPAPCKITSDGPHTTLDPPPTHHNIPPELAGKPTHAGATETAEVDASRPDASLGAERQPFGNAAPSELANACTQLLCEEPGAPPGGLREPPWRQHPEPRWLL